jgi:hypothetical protein
MATTGRAVLVLHDGDAVGNAIVQRLQSAGSVRVPAPNSPADELPQAAFGCRAIVAVGDRFAADPAVLGAADMPGVRALVVVVRGQVDLKPLRTRGVPYTVLRLAPALEEVVGALYPSARSARLILDARDDHALTFVAACDAAECAVRAIDDEDSCGRVVHVAAPERPRISELAQRIARALGHELKIATWPRWTLAAMRAIGRPSFQLPPQLRAEAPCDELESLHPGSWCSVEQIVPDTGSHRTAASRRNDEHAPMGM